MQDSVEQTPTFLTNQRLAQSKLHLTSSALQYRPFERPEQKCPLLRLPSEIRLEFYSYLLIESEPVDLTYEIAEDWHPQTGWHALFSTSLQIRNETLSFYLGHNIFQCQYYSREVGGLSPWLARLNAASPTATRYIKSIIVDIWPDEHVPLDWATAFHAGNAGTYAAYPLFD